MLDSQHSRFIKGTAEHLPNAVVTFDKFHAVKVINDAAMQVCFLNQMFFYSTDNIFRCYFNNGLWDNIVRKVQDNGTAGSRDTDSLGMFYFFSISLL